MNKNRLIYSHFIGAAVCFSSLAVAVLFMEKHLSLAPCPLCILDRIAVTTMGLLFLLGALSPLGKKTQAAVLAANFLCLAGGFIFAARHIWLQSRPLAEGAECLSDSESARHFTDLIGRAFGATADCGVVYWEFLGLTIPEQVFLLFVALLFLLIAQGVLIFRKE